MRSADDKSQSPPTTHPVPTADRASPPACQADCPTPDQIGELLCHIEQGLALGAEALGELVHTSVAATVPFVSLLPRAQLLAEVESLGRGPVVAVQLPFAGDFVGVGWFMLERAVVERLLNLLQNRDPQHVDMEAITEAGNIVLNRIMGALSNSFELSLSYAVPEFKEGHPGDLFSEHADFIDSGILLAQTRYAIRRPHIDASIVVLFGEGSFKTLREKLEGLEARTSRRPTGRD